MLMPPENVQLVDVVEPRPVTDASVSDSDVEV